MPTRQETPINNTILKWAREQAHFTPEQAVVRARIKDLKRKGITAAERLHLWEDGQQQPTLNELELIAKAYRRPLLTFFLSGPPKVESALKDFRTFGDKPVIINSPEFAAFRRQLEALQREVRLLVEEEGGKPLDFVGSGSIVEPTNEFVQKIRDIIGFSYEKQERLQSREELFTALRTYIEQIGVFVLRKADLGSHHSNIEVEEFRGLVISDPYAPFIVVNPHDAKVAMLFSLVHEFAHLRLGESGISNFDVFGTVGSGYQERELYCNKIASEFLVPEQLLLIEWQKLKNIEVQIAVQSLSKTFKVSRVVIARRLVDFKQITTDVYWDLYNQWRNEWNEERARLKETEGPGYFVKTKSQLGNRLLNTVIRAAYEGRLSYSDASKLLGVKVDYFNNFYGEKT